MLTRRERQRRRRIKLLIAAFAIGDAILLLVFHPLAAVPPVLVVAWIAAPRVRAVIVQGWAVVRASGEPPLARAPGQPDKTLTAMGLPASTVADIVGRARQGDVRLGIFDQNNRLVSEVGPIHPLVDDMIDPESFSARRRHTLEVVVAYGWVCIRKRYSNWGSMGREVAALRRLGDVARVPKIVAVDRHDRVLYQTFIPGRSLGSLMVEVGVSVTDQQRLYGSYPGLGRWRDGGAPELRELALEKFRSVVDRAFLVDLERLIGEIHAAGVLLRDVKLGNILVGEDGPYICDFDSAWIFRPRSGRRTKQETIERDRFDYMFGTSLSGSPGT